MVVSAILTCLMSGALSRVDVAAQQGGSPQQATQCDPYPGQDRASGSEAGGRCGDYDLDTYKDCGKHPVSGADCMAQAKASAESCKLAVVRGLLDFALQASPEELQNKVGLSFQLNSRAVRYPRVDPKVLSDVIAASAGGYAGEKKAWDETTSMLRAMTASTTDNAEDVKVANDRTQDAAKGISDREATVAQGLRDRYGKFSKCENIDVFWLLDPKR